MNPTLASTITQREINVKEIFKGDEIQTKDGDFYTVMMVYDTAVCVYQTNTVINASNIIAVMHPEETK